MKLKKSTVQKQTVINDEINHNNNNNKNLHKIKSPLLNLDNDDNSDFISQTQREVPQSLVIGISQIFATAAGICMVHLANGFMVCVLHPTGDPQLIAHIQVVGVGVRALSHIDTVWRS